MCFIGAFYNIIRVPPERDGSTDTLEGAKILCSIAPQDKSKPSYYHSFGEWRRKSVIFIIFRSPRQTAHSTITIMCHFIARHSEWCNHIVWMEWSYECAALKKKHFISLNLSGMSENYVVFIEQPIKMDLFKIVTGKLRGKSLNEGVYWDPNQETIFHLIDKQTGKVRPQLWQYSHRGTMRLFYICSLIVLHMVQPNLMENLNTLLDYI